MAYWLSVCVLLLFGMPSTAAVALSSSSRHLNAHLPTTAPPTMPVTSSTPPALPTMTVAPVGTPVVSPTMPTVPVVVTTPSAPVAVPPSTPATPVVVTTPSAPVVVPPSTPATPVVVTTPSATPPVPLPVPPVTSISESTTTTLLVVEGLSSTLDSGGLTILEQECLAFLQGRIDATSTVTMCRVEAQLLLDNNAVEFELLITGTTTESDMEALENQVAQVFMDDANQLITMLQDASSDIFGVVEGITTVVASTPAPAITPPLTVAPPVATSFMADTTVYVSVETLNGRLKDDDDIEAFQQACVSFLTAQEIQGVRGILRCTIEREEQLLIDAGGSVQLELNIIGLLSSNRPSNAFGAQIAQEFSEGSEIFIGVLQGDSSEEESSVVFSDVVRVTASLAPSISTSAPTVTPLRMEDNNDIFGLDRNVVIGAGAAVAAVALFLLVCLVCRSRSPPAPKPRTKVQSIPAQPTQQQQGITPPQPPSSAMRFPPPHPVIPRSNALSHPSTATTEAIAAVSPTGVRKTEAATLVTTGSTSSSLRSDMISRRVVAPPGRLGITVDTTVDGAAVHAIHEQSPLRGFLFPGDLILSINNTSTRGITGDQLRTILTETARQRREMEVASRDVTEANIPRQQRRVD